MARNLPGRLLFAMPQGKGPLGGGPQPRGQGASLFQAEAPGSWQAPAAQATSTCLAVPCR